MSDIFISYSRRDTELMHQLYRAFASNKSTVWVDWEDIPKGENWWKEIERGIENAEDFLCLISENWLVRPYCHKELTYARQHHKRVTPVILREPKGETLEQVEAEWAGQPWEAEARDNWQYLRSLNFVFFDGSKPFQDEFAALMQAITTDLPHIKAHTGYQKQAIEWNESAQNPSYLLLTADTLTAAETWLTAAKDKTPTPTDLHRQYIGACREAENARKAREAARERQIKRLSLAAFAAAIIGAIALAATAIAVPVSMNAINSNATSVAQVSTANVGLATATRVAQNAAALSTDISIAGQTLTPVPPTLTAVAQARENAEIDLFIAANLSDALIALEFDAQAALNTADRVVNTYPDRAFAYTMRAIVYNRLNQLEQSIEDYTKAIELDPQSIVAFYNRGLSYDQLGVFDKAVADYTTVIALDPANVGAYLNRGDVYQRQGELPLALNDVSFALTLDPQNAHAYMIRGKIYGELNQADEALADFNQALEINPDFISALLYRGATYAMQGEYHRAIADFSGVIALDPDEPLAYANRGDAYNKIEDYQQALDDFNTALELNPDDTESYHSRGIAYANLGDLKQAIADYTHAITVNPDDADYYHNRGKAYVGIQAIDLALRDFDQAIQLTPGDASIYITRGIAYYSSGDYEAAITDLSVGLQEFPDNFEAYYIRGRSNYTLNRLDEAIADYTRAIELAPDIVEAYIDLYNARGWVYYLNRDYPAAISDFTSVLALEPQNLNGLYYRALTYARSGDIDNALRDYDNGISIDLEFNGGISEWVISDITYTLEIHDTQPALFLFRGYLEYTRRNFDQTFNDWQQYEQLGGTFPPELLRLWDELKADAQ